MNSEYNPANDPRFPSLPAQTKVEILRFYGMKSEAISREIGWPVNVVKAWIRDLTNPKAGEAN